MGAARRHGSELLAVAPADRSQFVVRCLDRVVWVCAWDQSMLPGVSICFSVWTAYETRARVRSTVDPPPAQCMHTQRPGRGARACTCGAVSSYPVWSVWCGHTVLTAQIYLVTWTIWMAPAGRRQHVPRRRSPSSSSPARPPHDSTTTTPRPFPTQPYSCMFWGQGVRRSRGSEGQACMRRSACRLQAGLRVRTGHEGAGLEPHACMLHHRPPVHYR